MTSIQQLRKEYSDNRFPPTISSTEEAHDARGGERAMSTGTRMDLMLLSVWLVAAVLAAVGILLFSLVSLLPVLAR
jgi:hypothetical protein